MKKQALLKPFTLGNIELKNRIVMAPMTRSRAGEGNVPQDLNASYYRQRSSAGLIITEASQISPQGVGYTNTPGIHNKEQVAGWKKVTDAVHEAGGKIFIQLWHVGRISHPDFHNGALPVSASAIKPDGQTFTPEGMKDYVAPRALETGEIAGIMDDYRKAAQLAKDAGFDGVELHAANGYLVDQFLQDLSNHRTDEYGGSVENRARFLFEVLDALLEVWDSHQVGIRLSPSGTVNTMGDSDPQSIFGYVINKLNDYDLAFLHVINPMGDLTGKPQLVEDVVGTYASLYQGTRILNGSYDQEQGNQDLEDNRGELIAYGRPFLANPDLPLRFELGAPLNKMDPATLYGGDDKGYTDYPFFKAAPSAVTE